MFLPRSLIRSSLALLAASAAAGAQTTWRVDDDAPGDPGPLNPLISDPLENGSAAHPFDRIQEAVDAAADGDEVLIEPGHYFDLGTIDVSAGLGAARSLWIHSSGGPSVTTVDAAPLGPLPVMKAISGENADTRIEGLTLIGGDATAAFPNDRGGGLYCNFSSPAVRDCVFSANAGTAGGALYVNGGAPRFEDCSFAGNSSANGGAAYLNSAQVTFERCRFEQNGASGQGGALHVRGASGSIVLRDSVFYLNSAPGNGGAIFKREGTLTVERSTFTSNASTVDGGAVYCESANTFRDCVFNANSASGNGGALRAPTGTSLTLTHCTVFDQVSGSGVHVSSATLTLRNCILWGNVPVQLQASGGTVSVAHSDVMGGYAGTANIDADPLFEDAAGPDSIPGTLDDDLRLFDLSPCIDAGDSRVVASQLPHVPYPVDLAGRPRGVDARDLLDTGIAVLGMTVDLGAFEFQTPEACPVRTVTISRR